MIIETEEEAAKLPSFVLEAADETAEPVTEPEVEILELLEVPTPELLALLVEVPAPELPAPEVDVRVDVPGS